MVRAYIWLLVLALLVPGCVRAWTSTSADPDSDADGAGIRDLRSDAVSGPDGGGDLPARVDFGGGAVTVSKANDTCPTPLVVDMKGLAPGSPIKIKVVTAGAKKDYPLSICGAWPDVVVRLINSPGSFGQLMQSCSGGGKLATVVSSTGVCPGIGGNAGSATCGAGNSQSLSIPPGTAHIMFCRDPALGPAVFTIRK